MPLPPVGSRSLVPMTCLLENEVHLLARTARRLTNLRTTDPLKFLRSSQWLLKWSVSNEKYVFTLSVNIHFLNCCTRTVLMYFLYFFVLRKIMIQKRAINYFAFLRYTTVRLLFHHAFCKISLPFPTSSRFLSRKVKLKLLFSFCAN